MKPNVLFLYTEIAEYFLAACAALTEKAEVYIFRWPLNKEAPFKFEIPDGVHIIERNQYDTPRLIEKVKEVQPNAIFCSGWVDKGYLKVVQEFSGKIPTIISLDNQWRGTLKQRIACLGAQYSFLKYFECAWVPGAKQVEYASRLGFSNEKIHTGFYIANLDRFNEIYNHSLEQKRKAYPKSFFYLGRYVEHKGIFDLWQAFKKYRMQGGTWKLVCAGTGDQWENRMEYEGISHLGFKQPNDIPALLEQSGAYILPSHFEPWGVSVHEMAAAGLPLLLSDAVGSKDTFLQEGVNGFGFKAHGVEEIAQVMHQLEELDSEALQRMSNKSNIMGQLITQESWVETVVDIINRR